MPTRKKIAWPLPAAVLVLAAVLRSPGFFSFGGGAIHEKLFWYDESYSAFFASRPLAEIVRLSGYDTSPGLFAVLLHFWSMAAGNGAIALAALPYALSLASVAVVGLLGAELGGRKTGLIAAFLLALNPLHIRYATEVRAYSLEFLLAALSALFLVRMMRRPEGNAHIAWAAAVILGLYSHYVFLVVALIELAILAVWLARGRMRIRRTAGAAAAVAAGFLPQLAMFRRWGDLLLSEGASSFFQRGFGHGDFTTVIVYFATLAFGERRFYALTPAAAAVTVAAGLAVLILVGWKTYRERADAAMFGAGSALLMGIGLLMAGRFIHAPRYYLVFVLPFVLFAALWLASLRRRALVPALAAIIMVSAIPAALATVPPQATAFLYYGRAFAQTVAKETRPDDLVLLDHFTDILFRRYYAAPAQTVLFFPKRGSNVTDLAERFGSCDYDYMSPVDEATLAGLTAGRDRVWTVDYLPQRTSIQDPGGLKRHWLESHFRLAETVEFPAEAPPGAQKVVLLRFDRH